MAEGASSGSQASLVHLDGVKAQKFLRSLAGRPFVAVVIEDEHAQVYCKGMSEGEAARIMQSLAEQIESEEANADTDS